MVKKKKKDHFENGNALSLTGKVAGGWFSYSARAKKKIASRHLLLFFEWNAIRHSRWSQRAGGSKRKGTSPFSGSSTPAFHWMTSDYVAIGGFRWIGRNLRRFPHAHLCVSAIAVLFWPSEQQPLSNGKTWKRGSAYGTAVRFNGPRFARSFSFRCERKADDRMGNSIL